jgi:hypothetical protein
MRNKKIDIFRKIEGKWVYFCSTNQAKTCRDAKRSFLETYPIILDFTVMCRFSKD